MPDAANSQLARFDPLCLILGWVWPGLGYARIGEWRRGALVASGVLLLVVIGILVGGVDVVDRRDDYLWFLPQLLIGPLAFAIDFLNATFVKSGKLGTPSLGHVNEIGTLYVALAGLMNLAAMIDSATRRVMLQSRDRDPKRRREDHPEFAERRAQTRAEAADGASEPERRGRRDSASPPQRSTLEARCSTLPLLLGFVPFFSPINFFQTWWALLALPLAFAISMTYKAMRYREYRNYWRQVALMTLQILLGMAVMMVALYFFVDKVVPFL